MHPIFTMDQDGNIKIRPIGYVKSPINKAQTGGFTELETEIKLSVDCGKCFDCIEDFSHIIVVYWLNQITEYREKCRPQGNMNVPLLGQLATR